MAHLRNVPYRKVARALETLGFIVVRQRGSHVRFVHPDGRSTTVPKHGDEPIGPKLVSRIGHDVGSDAQRLRNLLGR